MYVWICTFIYIYIYIYARTHTHTHTHKYIYVYIYIYIWVCAYMCWGFTNGPEDQGSIPSLVIPKTQKMVRVASLLNTQHYKVWIDGKWNNPGKGVGPSPSPQCSSYWKGSLWVAIDSSRLTIFTHTHTHTYIYIYIY